MTVWRLIRLETTGYRPFTVVLAPGFVACFGLRVPAEPLTVLTRTGPLVRRSVFAGATFFLAWTFAYLFAGFSAVTKKEHRVYDRYFSFPVAALETPPGEGLRGGGAGRGRRRGRPPRPPVRGGDRPPRPDRRPSRRHVVLPGILTSHLPI